jgi:hypothetical protein
MVGGFWRDVELPDPQDTFDEVEKKIAEKMGFRASSDERYKILEMHVDLDLPDDPYGSKDDKGEATGIAVPYIVTIEKQTQTILAIRRNWRPEDDTYQKRNHFVHYGYIPGFGFYCLLVRSLTFPVDLRPRDSESKATILPFRQRSSGT